MKWIVGVDEAGRGPLAGPLTVSAFVAPTSLRQKFIKILGGPFITETNKIRDSKKLSEKKRENIYRELSKLRKLGQIQFCVSHISNKIIDNRGISYATKLGIKRCLKNCREDAPLGIRLDGLLKAPEEYKNQKTIIGGDGKDVFIACASIVAKVRRDRLMFRLANKFPNYAFEIHKGYGTTLHRKLIKKYRLSDIHRISFCKSLKY